MEHMLARLFTEEGIESALCEGKKIDDLQDTCGVYYEKEAEPDYIRAPRAMPEGESFPKDCPKSQSDEHKK
jgi:hypothetical protein